MPTQTPTFDEDAENVIAYLTERGKGHELASMVCRKMHEVEGFAQLPAEMRERIEEQAALLFATGYLHAVTDGRA